MTVNKQEQVFSDIYEAGSTASELLTVSIFPIGGVLYREKSKYFTLHFT